MKISPQITAEKSSPLPWDITSYVRGFAILAVIVNHYAIFYFHAKEGYANSLVSLFFLLGGAGVHLSMEKDGAGRKGTGAFPKFFYKRAARIFPLYWLAYAVLMIELVSLGQFAGSFTGFNLVTALSGVPTYPRGIFWFVTAILECYLAAPLLFLIIRRQGAKAALGTALLFFAASVMVTIFLLDYIDDVDLIGILSYKMLFLGNVLLFFLGMLMPPLVSLFRQSLQRHSLWAGAAVCTGVLTYATDIKGRVFTGSEIFLAPFLFGAVFVFCLSIAAAAPRLPFGRLMRLAGDNSYPLYLLHQSFFIGLVALGVITEFSYASVGYTVLIFPVFVVLCVSLERGFSRARSAVGELVFSRPEKE